MTLSSTNQRFTYKSRIEDCDVVDRAALIEYRTKRQEWLKWYELHVDEPHSIQQQIMSMIFVDLSYRMMAIPRAEPNPNVSAKSGLLAHLLDQGYVATQVLAVRRLLDGRTDVISLRRLFDDIENHKRLFTREIYVGYDGFPYDFEEWKSQPQDVMTEIWGIEAPGLQRFLMSRQLHEKFDRLAGTLPGDRQRNDLIREEIFQKLRGWLENDAVKKLIKLSHKFFAHAADMSSRGSLTYSGIQLSDITEIHRALILVERAITDELLFIGVVRNVVPSTPLGFLKGLDHPYAENEFLTKMQEHWEQLADERDKWLNTLTSELYH
ncbi:MAG TPA: hypothetical protein VLK33_15550 [Terriglobales bacterium]|nr:hypothetical protein [Terriglobales bacterium]